jgi:hypothetical protein
MMIEAVQTCSRYTYAGTSDSAARFHERMAIFGPALALARADEVIE